MGQAIFAPSGPECLAYTEVGVLYPDSGRPTVHRSRYLYRLNGDQISVFRDGSPERVVHIIQPYQGQEPNHYQSTEWLQLCIPDIYQTSYEFLADGSFIARHHLFGPGKNCLTTTIYTPAPPSSKPV